MTFNKKLLAGLVALAAASSANATVVVGGDNGFEFSVDGEINQFVVFTNDNTTALNNTSARAGKNTTEVRDGLLPGFLGFNVKAPTTNGLDIAARVSISPSTNGTSRGAGTMEQREAFGTITGSFGQVLLGKALGLYGSHNILTDQTLYGVGYGQLGNGTTTLGRINLGYDYADWRSQVKYTTPDMNGFKAAVAILDSTNGTSVGAPIDSKHARFEGDLSYAGTFDGGKFLGWVSGMRQSNEGVVANNQAWTVGGTLNVSGFEAMAQYSDSQQGSYAKASSQTLNALGVAAGVPAVAATGVKIRYDQYILQAGYNFGGSTRLVGGYSKYNLKTAGQTAAANRNGDKHMWTVGVYHDVTANLKLVAEYSKVKNDWRAGDAVSLTAGKMDQDIFSLGGFVSW